MLCFPLRLFLLSLFMRFNHTIMEPEQLLEFLGHGVIDACGATASSPTELAASAAFPTPLGGRTSVRLRWQQNVVVLYQALTIGHLISWGRIDLGHRRSVGR